jgi:AraC-like DNA-binding protein
VPLDAEPAAPRLTEAKAVRGFERAFKLHFHPERSIVLVHRGTSRARLGSTWYAVAEGDLVVIPAFLPHVCNPDRKGHWSYDLILVDEGRGSDAAAARPTEGGGVVVQACDTCRMLFSRALSLREAQPLLDHLAGHGPASRGGLPHSRFKPTIEAAAARLAGNLERPPHLEELSRPIGLDAPAFIRAFRKEYGITPHAWVLCLRIARAKELLRAGVPLAEAALEAGFTDQSHLSRHFVRLVGLTPAVWVRANDNFVQDSPIRPR